MYKQLQTLQTILYMLLITIATAERVWAEGCCICTYIEDVSSLG